MKVTIQELRKREDGSVYGLGNIVEVDKADALELVGGGDYKFLDEPIGAIAPEKEVAAEVEDAE